MIAPTQDRPPVVFLLSGLGGDSELFSDYRFPFPARAIDYSPPLTHAMDFPEYALQLISENDIRAHDSLIGVSLGGILSQEIARHLCIQRLTLISSCTDSRHIQPCIRRLRPLSRLIPWRTIQRIPPPSILLNSSRRRGLAMFRRADPGFISWACLNAAVWQCPAAHPDLFQIHGDRDPVFPISRQKIHHLIRGGDHLMAMSHWQEIQPVLIARHQPDFPAKHRLAERSKPD